MKRNLYLLSLISFLVLFIISTEVFAVRVKFKHSVNGKIVATDSASAKPAITIEYTKEDKRYRIQVKKIKLRIGEETNILDKNGEQLEKEDLEVGDTVSASYKNKYGNDGLILWRTAKDITVTSGEK